ncbi:hypothetical protein AVL62_14270 [Serinicoccus chungangensis]|uniref:Uncharacterized protein n=1 Tax=Serinicoccus chungangensis TaxID=767452 RepID=A0A0W8I477_9MICO|nr:hypothetical protein AVL62_14270 [Serinicoccus chungangensis]
MCSHVVRKTSDSASAHSRCLDHGRAERARKGRTHSPDWTDREDAVRATTSSMRAESWTTPRPPPGRPGAESSTPSARASSHPVAATAVVRTVGTVTPTSRGTICSAPYPAG